MVRVSSFGQQQLLIRGIMNNQSKVFDAQRQIATGKKTDEYRGLAGETGTVLGARSFKSRVETYQQTIDTIRGKLDANDVQLEGMIGAMEKMKESIQTTLANGQAEGFSELLDQTFKFVVNSLNTNFDGTYLFSGAKTGSAPVNVKNLTELDTVATTPGTVDDAFDNGNVAFEARIADGVDLEFGLLADNVAGGIFQEMLDLYRYDQTDELQGELSQTQFDFLQGQIASIDTAINNLRQVHVSNGLAYERLEVVDEQHADTSVFLETFISDLEDVDIAEAITRLNNDQVALEASYRAIGSLSQLSLLNFL
ncbi:flagellin [Kordiimonas gwangyangensis]|uniref:flagellin n=1 Tax=Kordiimonas gwangyangensis TaxID=288022 RepID=UPI0003709A66|nr:flagellin [Kordiimonas gwangyangensis]